MDLFSAEAGLQPIPIEDGELAMLAQLPLPIPNADVLRRLVDETPWRAETIVVYGQRHLQPRLTAWYGDAGYTYSGLTLDPLPMTPLLRQLHAAVEAATRRRYNSVLLNYYRDGADSMGMHSDDERELGREPAIASLSFGATRTFVLRHKASKRTLKFDLTDGSLLLMAGSLQTHWLHGINKTAKPTGARVNLTFRYIA
ncbi:alpha-ketoglutarate-dependent dioxygenase AlkB [Massilia sp. YIM B02763]|uniref:alpha-ketoglutarate-dependent dioxygenase AlkB family protein n=1 Tax=Massilia sp. YIM B02763 TaxID=3050130 RepID=UPI0025B6A08B|nr:alpha-ketoglutarate-dependent dioxygenase AlkB [Massilia sp. YIM B02763]MDN4053807.1 alpha-ketoglutarate-dependent dioxygenase AlkB [Massilia sp. YIM B02763]